MYFLFIRKDTYQLVPQQQYVLTNKQFFKLIFGQQLNAMVYYTKKLEMIMIVS